MKKRGLIWGVGAAALLIAGVAGVRIYKDRPQPRPWVLAAHEAPQERFAKPVKPKPSARSFAISINSGQCNPDPSPLDRVEVDEDTGSVTVTAYVDPAGSPFHPYTGGSDCLSYLSAVAHLDAPIGRRSLVVGGYPSANPYAFR